MFEVKQQNQPSGQKAVLLCSSDQANSCNIHLYGATIVSWISGGEEKLFLSEKAHLDGSKAVRGGVPLVFPQFGQPDTSMPQHGFARNRMWATVNSRTTDNCCEVELVLREDEETLSVWPNKFILVYIVKLSSNSLTTELRIINPSSISFSCQALLHTYLRIQHIENITCNGFSGFEFIDKMNNNTKSTETNNSIVIDREVDRVYCSKSEEEIVVYINDSTGKQLFKVQSKAKLSKVKAINGSESVINYCEDEESVQLINTDVVLWNAWIEKAKALADMNDDGYLYYVCVEPGLVSSSATVAANSVLALSQIIES